jgi:hypothetical protein
LPNSEGFAPNYNSLVSDWFQHKNRDRAVGLLLMLSERWHLVGLLFVQPIALCSTSLGHSRLELFGADLHGDLATSLQIVYQLGLLDAPPWMR